MIQLEKGTELSVYSTLKTDLQSANRHVQVKLDDLFLTKEHLSIAMFVNVMTNHELIVFLLVLFDFLLLIARHLLV